MPTRGQLSEEIQTEVGGRQDNELKTVVDAAIDRAVEHYEQERFSFNVSVDQTLMSEVDQTDYLLPDRVLNVQQVQFRADGDVDLLQKWSLQQHLYAVEDDTNILGEPSYFAIYGRNFFVYPAPNEIAPFKFYAVMRELNTPFAADTQENAWTNEGLGLIRARVKWDLYTNRIKNAVLAEANANDVQWYYRKLKRDVNQLELIGQIPSSGPF